MIVRTSSAQWQGDLKQGKGSLELGSGAYKGPYSFRSRFEDGKETNPEELIAAAHAACYSMALAHGLSSAGHVPTSVKTSAKVHLEQQGAGFAITLIEAGDRGRGAGPGQRRLSKSGRRYEAELPSLQGPVRDEDDADGEAGVSFVGCVK